MRGDETLERVYLNKIDPMAVCNDGTPATYDWKKSPTGSNKWLIFLRGGGACWDEASCKERTTYKEEPIGQWWSSKPLPHFYNASGILSHNSSESPLWDANKALLDYCSSDYYMGGLGDEHNATTKFTMHWKFRGQNAVNAMI